VKRLDQSSVVSVVRGIRLSGAVWGYLRELAEIKGTSVNGLMRRAAVSMIVRGLPGFRASPQRREQ